MTKNKAGDDAGGITNLGTLTLVDVLLSSNKAKDDAGAFDNDAGLVTLRSVTVSKNKAKDEAGVSRRRRPARSTGRTSRSAATRRAKRAGPTSSRAGR